MNILIYGDSNTCGYKPNINGYSKNATPTFFAKEDVWWYELQKNNNIIVNALCGRAINHEHPIFENRNAMKTVLEDVMGITPDLTIVMLGTNDLKSIYGESAKSIASNLEILINKIKDITSCKNFLVISPPKIKEGNEITNKHYLGAEAKSVELDACYENLCKKCGYSFVSASSLEVGEDGEHLTKNGHKNLSQSVLQKVSEIKKEKQEMSFAKK